jgi:hypothetical protein
VSRETVTAYLWKCDGYTHLRSSDTSNYCKGSVLTQDNEMPHGWERFKGVYLVDDADRCGDCVRRAEYDRAQTERQAELVAVRDRLAANGIPGGSVEKNNTILVEYGNVFVSICREGSKTVRWRASGMLPGGTTLDTRSPDVGRLASAVIREIRRAHARVFAAKVSDTSATLPAQSEDRIPDPNPLDI